MHVVRLLCNEEEIIVSGPKRTFAPGSIVPTGSHTGFPGEFILSEPPPGRRGHSLFSLDFPAGTSMDTYGISSADPGVLAAGDDQPVTLLGWGFRESPVDLFDAVIYDEATKSWIADPYVTIHDVVWVSETEVEVEVDVDPDAGDEYQVTVRVRRG